MISENNTTCVFGNKFQVHQNNGGDDMCLGVLQLFVDIMFICCLLTTVGQNIVPLRT